MDLYFEPIIKETENEKSIRIAKVTKKSISKRINDLKGLGKTQYDFDGIVRIIRQSRTPENAKVALQDCFKLTASQANFILETHLTDLFMIDKEWVEEEIKKLKALKALLDE
jgi:DNA gyrase subunit A